MSNQKVKIGDVEIELQTLDTLPYGESLVYLEEPLLNTRWAVATKVQCMNGHSLIVGGLFSYDAPKIIGWMNLPTFE